MKLKQDMIGRKITCFIDGIFIEDAEIHYEYNRFFILQNKCHGCNSEDKKEYNFSWVIQDPENLQRNGVRGIEIKKYKQNSLTPDLIKYILTKK